MKIYPFLKNVKQHPKLKFVPVLMLTTVSEKEKKMQGKEAGAKAWMVKPFKPEQLISAVSKLIMP